MFDVADLVAIATRERDPIFLDQAKRSARRTFAYDRHPGGGAIKRIMFIIMRSDNDQLELISVGKRGGHKVEWRFGGGLAPRRATLDYFVPCKDNAGVPADLV